MNKALLLLTAFLFLSAVPQSKADGIKFYSCLLSDSTDNLTAFSAKIKDNEIHLIWKISNPKLISYFIIERTENPDKGYKKLNENDKVRKSEFIEKSSDNNILSYKFTYTDVPEQDGVFYYRLKAFSANGELVFYSDDIKIGISGIKDFTLEQNIPNPFNPTTTIKYELQSDTHVSVVVFDLIGKEIATLVDKFQTAGKYSVDFDASRYSNLTSGIYFFKLQTEKFSDVKKMILSK